MAASHLASQKAIVNLVFIQILTQFPTSLRGDAVRASSEAGKHHETTVHDQEMIGVHDGGVMSSLWAPSRAST